MNRSDERICAHCGASFVLKPRAPITKKYCSRACNGAAWANNHPDRAKQVHANFYQRNRAKVYEWSRRWRANNPDKAKEVDRRAQATRVRVQTDDTRASRRRWYALHREERRAYGRMLASRPDMATKRLEWKLANPVKVKAYALAWYYKNKDAAFATVARRRARVRGAVTEKYSRQAIYDRDGGICQICFNPITAEWHIDHIIPIALGGADAVYNVQLAHPACNRKKGARTTQESEIRYEP